MASTMLDLPFALGLSRKTWRFFRSISWVFVHPLKPSIRVRSRRNPSAIYSTIDLIELLLNLIHQLLSLR